MTARAVLAIAAVALLVASAEPAQADAMVPAAGHVQVSLQGPGNDYRHTLVFDLYPQRGIALVSTRQGEALSAGVLFADTYAVAIPKEPFEGSIDVDFPGVGEIVGAVVAKEATKPELPAKVCDGSPPVSHARFEGRIRFGGRGGYRPWAGHKAEASISPECRAPSGGKSEAEELFGAVAEFGPILPGPAGFRFFAGARPPGRVVEFIAFGNVWEDGSYGTFAAIDKEWLPGEIATERVVSRTTKAFLPGVEVDPDRAPPDHVTFAPPPPFFGRATYRRRTGKLRGSLGVRFLGLSLRLAQRPMSARLEDEDVASGHLRVPGRRYS